MELLEFIIYSSICIEIDGNDAIYDNSPENGKKKKKEIENKERTAWKAKGRGDIYANKRKGLLVN